TVLVGRMGWSPVLADAVARAVAGAAAQVPGCQARVALVAAVVEIEAGGGRGRAISATGDTDPRVIGPALDGSTPGTATIADTDGGRWDGDIRWDHAVGIAQFLPSTWAASGIDASGDGVADPHNVYDAVASQVAKLCRDGLPLASDADERRALFAYNNAGWYVDQVMAKAAEIQQMIDEAGPGVEDAATVERPGGGTVELATVGGITVASRIAPQLQALLAAASADGVILGGSGWRSTQRQIELRGTNGCPDLYTSPPESCAVPTAIPGTSMHEIGEAVDFTVDGQTVTRGSPAFAWLVANAARYGFFNLPSEPWHWSVNAK
ncbi:MAG: D-alanyl-D-alanine carboxypeptidase family protein, partial [Actinomycetota bacterium]|nr:D-alanyl-D-alanine carboxypeptidase family protein [Actinomycetota bacterium]